MPKIKPLPPAPSSSSFLGFKALCIAFIPVLVVSLAFLVDDQIDAFVRLRDHSAWKPLAWFMTRYADWPFLILYACLFFMAGVAIRCRKTKNLAMAMVLSCVIAGVPVTLARSLSGRTRPNATAPQGWYGMRNNSQWLIGKTQFNSFPSGHVGAGVGFAMPLILGTRRRRMLAIAFCVVLAWARVFTGYHHLSDVIAAAIVGIAAGCFVLRWIMPRLAGFGESTPLSRSTRSLAERKPVLLAADKSTLIAAGRE